MPLTTDQIATFHRDGVLVLRGAIAGAHLDLLRQRAQALRARAEREQPEGLRIAPGHEPAARAAPRERRGDWTWGVNEITRRGWHDPALVDVLGWDPVHGALESLLDRPRAWGLKMLWAPRACDYVLHWHRDISNAFDALMPFKPAINDHVQFNAALFSDPSFRVVPGSHRRRLGEAEWTALRRDRCGPMPGEVQIVLEPGDVLFMDAHALHRGGVPAGHERLTLHFSAQAQWVPLKPWSDPEDWRWMTGPEFIGTLTPAARPFYERLTHAPRDDHHQYAYLVDQARRAGWNPPADWVMPGQEPYHG